MTGTDYTSLHTNPSRSYLNHLVLYTLTVLKESLSGTECSALCWGHWVLCCSGFF